MADKPEWRSWLVDAARNSRGNLREVLRAVERMEAAIAAYEAQRPTVPSGPYPAHYTEAEGAIWADGRAAIAAEGKEHRPMRCQPCGTRRAVSPCHKCGSDLFEEAKGWEEPALPPVERVRELAKEVGYAVGVHGSLERDLDLIAVPWTENAVSPEALASHIAYGLPGTIHDAGYDKPHGRYALNIQMEGWFKLIDLSIAPKGSVSKVEIEDTPEPRPSVGVTREAREKMIVTIIRDVAELPDRTSPVDQPDMMMVTADELEAILRVVLASYQQPGEKTTEDPAQGLVEALERMADPHDNLITGSTVTPRFRGGWNEAIEHIAIRARAALETYRKKTNG